MAEVANKGYDQEEFATFLNSKKGTDVTYYTLDEMYTYVYEFQTAQWEKHENKEKEGEFG